MIALLGPLLVKHHKIVHDPWIINDDQRILTFEFYHEHGDWLFKGDYISDYLLSFHYSLGFSSLYSLVGILGDPLIFSKYLQEFLFLLLLVFFFLIGKSHENSLVGILCLLTGFCTLIYLNRIAGGLPRSFAYPLMAGFCWGLISSRLWILISMLLLQVLFYPPVALPCSITFAVYMLFPKIASTDTGKLKFKSCLLILALIGVLSITFILPNIIRPLPYGKKIAINDIKEYPEAGQGGRYTEGNRPPFPSLKSQVFDVADRSFSGNGFFNIEKGEKKLILLITGFISLIGWFFLIYKRDKALWLIVYFLSACAAYEISRLLYPLLFLPQRTISAVSIFFNIGIIFGLVEFFKVILKKLPFSKDIAPVKLATILIFILMSVFFVDKKFPGAQLYSEKGNAEVLNYIKDHLPEKALIAGWPFDIDSIPLLSKKRILVGYETYSAFYTGYVLEMRLRMNAVIDAYFSDDAEAVRRLRDDFKVTHLLLNWKYFEPVKQDRVQRPVFLIPPYFAPHGNRIIYLLQHVPLKDRAIFKLNKELEEARIGNFSVLDLSKLK